ncbi:hypothetical protein LJR220_007076 [Bradyrhizobium sp. LjRoot220]|uniref:hypothetical protein n=1 Tax=Bradyrhizobium sp. LjRoot220 TaxID=3342284 RepID=UPI003ECD904B
MEDIRRYSGAILTGLAALVVVGALYVVFLLLMKLVNTSEVANGTLPLLAIGGVVVLILLLTAVAMVFSILNLTNKDQAMGLPEGSIRAVIALSLIVLFAILSVFLFQNISTGGSKNTIAEMSGTDRTEFIRSHANARDIQSTPTTGKPGFYDVTYRSANVASEDFAKQLLVLLGTLMTAITSFYLGAGTVTSAVKAGGEAAAATVPSPSLGGIKPATASIARDGPVLHLELSGANLNKMTRVNLVKAGVPPIAGSNVKSSATGIICDVDISKADQGAWAVEVDDGVSKPIKAQGNLTITA